VQVRVLSRRADFARDLWEDGKFEIWEGDLSRTETLSGFMRDVRLLYHLAGEARENKYFEITNVIGTKNLLEACSDQRPERIVYLSSVGVIGARGKGVVDELTPCNPNNAYERSKYAGERAALAICGRLGIPFTVIRPSIVFGKEPKRAHDSFAAWLRAIDKGWFRFIGSCDAVANYIYVEDLVRACLLAGESDKAADEVYIASDPCSMRDFVFAATEFLGTRMPGTIPVWLAYGTALGFEAAGRFAHFSPPLTVSRVKALTSQVVYSSDKLHTELGFSPSVGWREGLRRTIEWCKQSNLL
jgi:nucleoside-diphosphate-sugar epimerase